MGAGRLRGLFDVISKKFYTYNLAGEFDKFLRTLIANRKYKLAVPVAAKSAKFLIERKTAIKKISPT